MHVTDYKNISLPLDVVNKILWCIRSHDNDEERAVNLLYNTMHRIGDDFSFIPFIPIMARGGYEIVLMDKSTYRTLESTGRLPMGFLTFKRDTVLDVIVHNDSRFEYIIKFTLVRETNFIVDRPDSIIRDADFHIPSFYQQNTSNLRIGFLERKFSILTEKGVNLF